jgi:gamma-glutamylcyclotransferase (GGCT)/AIG2-like uncharacterized protein YtfP
MLIFVYGNLRRGGVNYSRLRNQRFAGEGSTLPIYRIVSVGAFRRLIEARASGTSIDGEVCEGDAGCVRELDRFEGYEWRRRPIRFKGFDNVDASIWAGPRN